MSKARTPDPAQGPRPMVRRRSPGTRLRLGVHLNSTQKPFRWSEIREVAVTAEAAGFASIWTEDHLYYPDHRGRTVGAWEGWTILGALADATSTIRIGTLVTPLVLRRPVMVAKEATTIEEISGGRLVLGLGAGWSDPEHRAMGAPLEPRVSRFEEALAILTALLQTGHVEFRGRYYDVDAELTPRASVRPLPELMVGSSRPRMLRATLPQVDGWNWDGFTMDWPHLRSSMALVDETCREIGRDPGEVWRSAHLATALPGALGLPVDLPPDEPVLGGDLQALAEGLRSCAEEGLDEVTLIVDPPTPEAIELLARAADLAAT
jgi:alkanesulfonate monooxygenase SsuD/methylene tetrahydromethanopterin reductase-like flavin-dependent oxidoreductase (luciferase family)